MHRMKFALVAACMPLAGCGLSLAGDGGKFAIRAIDTGEINLESSGSAALDEARKAMRGGNVAAAMTAFRIAQRDPATEAEATNGLGVAWATLGRHDVAEKLFIEAMALAPKDARFAANLERLYTDKAMAKATAAAQFAALQPKAQPAVRSTLRSDVVSAAGSSDRIVRVSAREVMIGNTPSTTAAPAKLSQTEPADSPIRVAIPRRGDRIYPVRAVLPASSPVTVDQREPSSGYPLRVAIKTSRGDSNYPLRVQLPGSGAAAQ